MRVLEKLDPPIAQILLPERQFHDHVSVNIDSFLALQLPLLQELLDDFQLFIHVSLKHLAYFKVILCFLLIIQTHTVEAYLVVVGLFLVSNQEAVLAFGPLSKKVFYFRLLLISQIQLCFSVFRGAKNDDLAEAFALI